LCGSVENSIDYPRIQQVDFVDVEDITVRPRQDAFLQQNALLFERHPLIDPAYQILHAGVERQFDKTHRTTTFDGIASFIGFFDLDRRHHIEQPAQQPSFCRRP
jgi:hypothetical protein